jgi:hypothetical protein
MKILLKLSLLAVLLLLVGGGCVVNSLHPLYTEKDLVFDPALLGEWTPEDSNDSWTFTRRSEKQYKVVLTNEDNQKAVFIGHLARINGVLFLDIVPDGSAREGDPIEGTMLLLPAHLFARVLRIQPTLQVALLNVGWLEEHLKENPAAIKHEKVKDADVEGDQIVLTASSEDLQRFLIAHLKTTGAFHEPMEFTRPKK